MDALAESADADLEQLGLSQAGGGPQAFAQELEDTVGSDPVVEPGLGLHGAAAGHPPVGPRHQVEAKHGLNDGPPGRVGGRQQKVHDLTLERSDG